MDKELIKQKILANIEQRKIFWTVEIVLSGGMASLLVNMDSYVKISLFILGTLTFIFFMSAIRNVNRNLYYLFKVWGKNDDINTK